MLNVRQVWNSGLETPLDIALEEKLEFKRRTGSDRVVAMRWLHDGEQHELAGFATALPDLSGVAQIDGPPDRLPNTMTVINADGSKRFTIAPPFLSANLDETRARLESPRPGWPASGVPFGVYAAYLSRPVGGLSVQGVGVLLDIDWRDGRLIAWHAVPRGA